MESQAKWFKKQTFSTQLLSQDIRLVQVQWTYIMLQYLVIKVI